MNNLEKLVLPLKPDSIDRRLARLKYVTSGPKGAVNMGIAARVELVAVIRSGFVLSRILYE